MQDCKLFIANKIQLTTTAKEKIIEESYDENFGARPIKRYVSRNIESLLANAIIQNKIEFSSTVTIDYQNGKFIYQN